MWIRIRIRNHLGPWIRIQRYKITDKMKGKAEFNQQKKIFRRKLKSEPKKKYPDWSNFVNPDPDTINPDPHHCLHIYIYCIECMRYVSHPNLLNLLAYSNDGELLCLVYEYMEGGNLKDRSVIF